MDKSLAEPKSPDFTYLEDYRPYPYSIDTVDMRFDLDETATKVTTTLRLSPKADFPTEPLRLDGENLELLSLTLNGEILPEDSYSLDEKALILDQPPHSSFTLTTEVSINPKANTKLMGLYLSNGIYCTQCEAEGFRRITFYPDRPDVLSVFTVRIHADRKRLPQLLSNGNKAEDDGGNIVTWHDPHPKPSYLFALVAGDLGSVNDSFTTKSGRTVELNIYVEHGKEARADYAMESLKKSMQWDEDRFGLEYDLDIFNIVAVSDFNMGAMENKGLNVFNDRYVLADPQTATDHDYGNIEAVIAHEYFHNWTGNRITCRDWFQLCLKEGLTVYRDQRFSEDERGAGVERIKAVQTLRARQFREDAGPLAHPVRPESYQAIDNFYTATVYEKGAELVRMLRLLVGEAAWEAGLERYWSRHDGEAVTIEDWLACFADASGRDLSAFARWYGQAGTPRLSVEASWTAGPDGEGAVGTLSLTLRQRTPPTPGQPEKAPVPIPVAVGLLAPDGSEAMATTVLLLEGEEASFDLPAPEGAVPSLLRGFSAPVILEREASAAERAFLLAHDADPFARWEAGRQLGKAVLTGAVLAAADDPGALEAHLAGEAATRWLAAIEAALGDRSADPALRALLLGLPSEDDLAQTLHDGGHVPDPDAIRAAREALSDRAAGMTDALRAAMEEGRVTEPYRPDAAQSGRRALFLAALRLLARADGGAAAREALAEARDMTTSLGALTALLHARAPGAEEDAARFAARWADERLVMDRWFALTVSAAAPARLVPTAEALMARPDFTRRNPNRVRAVLGAVPANPAGFHAADGSGYRFLAAEIAALDALNPQVAARLTGAFETWRRYDETRRAHARAALRSILGTDGLSPDTAEMASRLLAPPAGG